MSENNVAKSRAPRIMITGASGVIGRRLLPLLNHMKPFAVINKYASTLPVDNVLSVDLTNRKEVEKIISIVNPDIVFHFAALSDPKYFVDLTAPPYNPRNVDILRASWLTITENIVECISPDTHLIFLSTDKVFDGTDSCPNENSPTNPLWMRAKFKVDCEKMIVARLNKYHIIRLSQVHGTGTIDSRCFIDKAIIQLKRKEIANVYDNVCRCYILHSELRDFLYSLITDDNFGIYNIGSKMMSYYDRICQICEDHNISYKEHLIPIKGQMKPMTQNLDTKKARNTFKLTIY